MRRVEQIGRLPAPPAREPDYTIQWEDYCVISGEEPPAGAFSVGMLVRFQPERENHHDNTAVRFVNPRGVRGGYLYRSDCKEAIFDALLRGSVVTGRVGECNQWGIGGSVDIWLADVPGYYTPREIGAIGREIVCARQACAIPQADLAGRLGISRQALSALEHSRTFYYPAEIINQIAAITGRSPDALGCREPRVEAQSDPVRSRPVQSGQSRRIEPIQRPGTGPAVGNRLTIRREPAAAYGARAVRVLVDGTELRRLANGGTCSTELPTGSHTVELILGRKTIGVQQVNIAASVDVTLLFTVAATGAAAIQITQISTAPAADGSWVPTQPQTGGEVYEARSRGNGTLLRLLLVIVIIWVLWVVLSNLTVTVSLVPTFE